MSDQPSPLDASGPRVILVVDDEPMVAKAIATILAADAHRVLVAHDPHEALAIVDREPVDLVITDRQMPGMSGHQLAEALHQRYPDVPCVMLTGAASLDSALAAINSGQVIRYLTKPLDSAELRATVAVGLARRAELRAAAERDDDVTRPSAPSEIGKYLVLGPLGEGGMGRVYRGLHTGLQRPVAIKILHGNVARDPVALARFEREARAAARARHPRIVETLDFGHLPDGRPYLVMELVEAETLRARLQRAPLEPIDAVRIARGIAQALAAAHAVDVVHRDLKPGNVFVDAELEVKLGDFGAAKLLDPAGESLTLADNAIGTPHYMAPEQILGEPIDGRADVYALGCLLFRMLAAAPPFRGPDTRSVLAQHLHAPVPVPTSPSRPLPAEVVEVVQAAMAKDPARRPQSATELIAALERAAAALDADAAPSP